MRIYKIFRPSEWDELRAAGETAGAPVDRADGFIHFSTGAQVAETAAKHFAGAGDLILARAESDALGPELKWEPSRGGALFPHLHRPLRLADIETAVPLPAGPEGHLFPEDLL